MTKFNLTGCHVEPVLSFLGKLLFPLLEENWRDIVTTSHQASSLCRHFLSNDLKSFKILWFSKNLRPLTLCFMFNTLGQSLFFPPNSATNVENVRSIPSASPVSHICKARWGKWSAAQSPLIVQTSVMIFRKASAPPESCIEWLLRKKKELCV